MTTEPSRYKLNHTMLRVKDPKKSLGFYEFLGLKVINTLKFPDNKFDLYFLAYDSPKAVSHGNHWTDREGIIELTHNYGTEDDPNYKVSNGNEEPLGFGHVAISVDNIQAACKRLEDAGYPFQRKFAGKMSQAAFVLDPDGYWVEIIPQRSPGETENVTETDPSTYRMNHTMIRIKDAEASLSWYQDVLGMTVHRTLKRPAAKFDMWFLGYGPPPAAADSPHAFAHREGLVQLVWTYGTEKDPNFKYHDGNSEPQGFGHLCITVDDLDAACARFEDKKVNWKKRLTDGRMKNVAFVLDPDGYWVEVVQNEKLKNRSNW